MDQAVPTEKVCTKCGGSGPFSKNKNAPNGLAWQCKGCTAREYGEKYQADPEKYRAKARKYQRSNPDKVAKKCDEYRATRPEWGLWVKAKQRAKKKGLAFTIVVDDIRIPEMCPLLGIRLSRGKGHLSPNSPTLDRRNSTLGYVENNVWVISHRANTMKSNATLEELELLVKNLRQETEETSHDSVVVH